MANVFVKEIDTNAEDKRPNLLDVIEERNRSLNKKSTLHRMVVISDFAHSNHSDIAEHYDKLFKDIQLKLQCEPATGLLLIFPRHCVHVLEAPLEIILELCRDLRGGGTPKSSTDVEDSEVVVHMESAKILVISHDIPCRLYGSYLSRVLDIEAANMDFDSTEGVEKVVSDLLLQLLRLGVYIHKLGRNMQKTALETLHDKAPELLPPQEVINYLLKTSSPCIYTPEEHLAKYENPFDVGLPSDLVWPIPSRMFPYG